MVHILIEVPGALKQYGRAFVFVPRAQPMRWSNLKASAGLNAYATLLIILTSGSDTGLVKSTKLARLKYRLLGGLRWFRRPPLVAEK